MQLLGHASELNSDYIKVEENLFFNIHEKLSVFSKNAYRLKVRGIFVFY